MVHVSSPPTEAAGSRPARRLEPHRGKADSAPRPEGPDAGDTGYHAGAGKRKKAVILMIQQLQFKSEVNISAVVLKEQLRHRDALLHGFLQVGVMTPHRVAWITNGDVRDPQNLLFGFTRFIFFCKLETFLKFKLPIKSFLHSD